MLKRVICNQIDLNELADKANVLSDITGIDIQQAVSDNEQTAKYVYELCSKRINDYISGKSKAESINTIKHDFRVLSELVGLKLSKLTKTSPLTAHITELYKKLIENHLYNSVSISETRPMLDVLVELIKSIIGIKTKILKPTVSEIYREIIDNYNNGKISSSQTFKYIRLTNELSGFSFQEAVEYSKVIQTKFHALIIDEITNNIPKRRTNSLLQKLLKNGQLTNTSIKTTANRKIEIENAVVPTFVDIIQDYLEGRISYELLKEITKEIEQLSGLKIGDILQKRKRFLISWCKEILMNYLTECISADSFLKKLSNIEGIIGISLRLTIRREIKNLKPFILKLLENIINSPVKHLDRITRYKTILKLIGKDLESQEFIYKQLYTLMTTLLEEKNKSAISKLKLMIDLPKNIILPSLRKIFADFYREAHKNEDVSLLEELDSIVERVGNVFNYPTYIEHCGLPTVKGHNVKLKQGETCYIHKIVYERDSIFDKWDRLKECWVSSAELLITTLRIIVISNSGNGNAEYQLNKILRLDDVKDDEDRKYKGTNIGGICLVTSRGKFAYYVENPKYVKYVMEKLIDLNNFVSTKVRRNNGGKREPIPDEVSGKREPIPDEVRRIVRIRDGGRCVMCGAAEYLEIDHIIPVSKGGSNSVDNLQLLCRKCNRRKGNK